MAPARSPKAWLSDVPRFTHEGVGRSFSSDRDRPVLALQGASERQERSRSWRPASTSRSSFDADEGSSTDLRKCGSVMFRASPTRVWDGVSRACEWASRAYPQPASVSRVGSSAENRKPKTENRNISIIEQRASPVSEPVGLVTTWQLSTRRYCFFGTIWPLRIRAILPGKS